MRKNTEVQGNDIIEARSIAAQLTKLPENVRVKILYMIEGARLVSEQKEAG